MTLIYFAVIAVMRLVQNLSNKVSSNLVNSRKTFFHYGAFYQLVSALIAFAALTIAGFGGFNWQTAVIALGAALLFSVDLYAGIESVKGGTMVLATMFANGGLFIPCIAGIFFFDEPMSLFQWGGLVLFIFSTWLLVSGSKQVYNKFSLRTLIMLVIHMLANGLIMVLQKVFGLYVLDANAYTYSFMTFGFSAVVMYLCMGISAIKKENRPERLSLKLAGCGASLAAALFTINLLVIIMTDIPSVILFTVLSAINVIATCLIGAIIFKEKLTLKNIIGLLLGFASIAVVTLL